MAINLNKRYSDKRSFVDRMYNIILMYNYTSEIEIELEWETLNLWRRES